jgi:class 3 adenylate cyclase
LSFRTLILATMLTVVVGTTAATLFVSQRQNITSYRAVVDELLRNQATFFQREQTRRHQEAARQVSRLAGSVRLFAALEAADPEVYKIARDELRPQQFSFFRLLDSRGELIPPPGGGVAGMLEAASLDGSLTPQTGTRVPRQQDAQLGFVEARQSGGRAGVYRVLAAPISNFGSQVGTLIFGERVGLFSEEAELAPTSPGLRSGLWLDGRLLGSDIPDAARRALTARLRESGELPSGAEFRANDASFRVQRSLLNAGSTYPPAYLISIFSMRGFEEQQQLLIWRTLLIGVVASVVAGLLALFTSRQLARPVAELVAATREIRRGNFEPRLTLSSSQEMRTLAEAFNAMAADLALKERYHSVLQQVADPQVAEELIAGRVKLGGELRDMTVMFCDIRDYTAFTVGRPPETVIELLNHHMGAMSEIVQAHGGVINQFAGDAIMALFGAPKSYGDDAVRAVRCARAMLEAREQLNAEADVPMRVGIGIASGAMVAGCIGAESRSDYTAVGERVNLAARLCSRAGANEIFIDEVTRQRMGDVFSSRPLQPLSLKGFEDPVQAHRVTLEDTAAA